MVNLWATLYDHTKINDVLKNGKFGNIITVSKDDKFANFCCADAVYGGSDSACIQAAIDHCATHNLKELWIFDGTYTISTQITGSADINIRGYGNVTFLSGGVSSTSPEILGFLGSKTATITGSDVVEGSDTITVSDASNIHIGDLLLISDTTVWNPIDYPTWNTGELHEVLAISGNTISFIDSLLHSYTVTNSLSIDIISPIVIDIENIKFVGASETLSQGLVFCKYTKKSTISNCEFRNGGYYGISVLNCYNTYIYNNNISNCKMLGLGYGISINNASAHTTVFNNTISMCRHCVASGGYGVVGQARDIGVHGNNLFGGKYTGAEHIIDAHACVESIYASGNTIYCNLRSAMVSGAKFSTFVNNKVFYGSGAGVRGNTQHVVYSVCGNDFNYCGYAYFDSLIENCLVDFASVKNNNMRNSFYYIAYTRVTSKIHVVGNTIDRASTYYGLSLLNVTSGIIAHNSINNTYRSGMLLTSCQNLDIHNNEVTNSNTCNTNDPEWGSGITLTNCTNNRVSCNAVSDSASKIRYCICERGTSNNNYIFDNILSGAVVGKILKLGVSSQIRNNVGYKTENTGTATIAATTTSIVVPHGLAATPTRVQLTATTDTLGKRCWVSAKTATTFTISIDSADATNAITFDWSAVV